MKILRKLRVVSVLVAFAILAGQFCTVNVNAAQGVEAAPIGTQLSGFRITDLDKPVPGKDLDFKARVRTNENVTWEIPVIWTDENGNTVTYAEPGKTYYPNFAFYIPTGYKINLKALGSKILVRLPDFLLSLYGEDSVLFTTDAGSGITYITFVQAVAGIAAKNKAAETTIAPAAVTTSTPASSDTSSSNDKGSSNKDSSDSSDPEPEPEPAPSDPISKSVLIHCSAGLIQDFAKCPEVLEEVVSLIKNKLEPQATALLKNAFSAYKNADPSAFGQKLGLYIYNKVGSIDGIPAPADALAYVSGGYGGTDEESVFHYVMGVDVSSFMSQDADGKWSFKENKKVSLNTTIVHEMMHAYMYDLTRRGMCETTDYFPNWFTEGMAVSVENAYQFRSSGLQPLSTASDDLWDSELKRFTEKVTYSVDSIVSLYSSAQTGDNRYQLQYSNSDQNLNSAYVSGYLAVIYLGYLAAERTGDRTSTPVISDDDKYINIDRIRDGLSSILSWINEGDSLESVIKYVSTSNLAAEGEGVPRYATVAKFEEKFIQGSDGENEGGIIFSNDGDRSIYGSAKFAEVFLNFLEENSAQGEGLDNTTLANGSVLRQDQHYQTLLNWETEPAKTLYAMTDEEGAGGFVNSTADNDKAWNHTGGRTIDHGADVVEFPAGGGEAGTGAAASTAPADEIASSSSDSSVSETSEPSSGSSSSADTDAATVPEVTDAPVDADTPVVADTPVATDTPAVADTPAASDTPIAADSPAVADTPVTTDTPIAADSPAVADLAPVADGPSDIINTDTGITDAGQDLVILPAEQDAITPDEITPASSETISSSDPEPAPESEDNPSDEPSSSESGDSSESSESEE